MRALLFTFIQYTFGSGSPDVTQVMLKESSSITNLDEVSILSTAAESTSNM